MDVVIAAYFAWRVDIDCSRSKFCVGESGRLMTWQPQQIKRPAIGWMRANAERQNLKGQKIMLCHGVKMAYLLGHDLRTTDLTCQHCFADHIVQGRRGGL